MTERIGSHFNYDELGRIISKTVYSNDHDIIEIELYSLALKHNDRKVIYKQYMTPDNKKYEHIDIGCLNYTLLDDNLIEYIEYEYNFNNQNIMKNIKDISICHKKLKIKNDSETIINNLLQLREHIYNYTYLAFHYKFHNEIPYIKQVYKNKKLIYEMKLIEGNVYETIDNNIVKCKLINNNVVGDYIDYYITISNETDKKNIEKLKTLKTLNKEYFDICEIIINLRNFEIFHDGYDTICKFILEENSNIITFIEMHYSKTYFEEQLKKNKDYNTTVYSMEFRDNIKYEFISHPLLNCTLVNGVLHGKYEFNEGKFNPKYETLREYIHNLDLNEKTNIKNMYDTLLTIKNIIFTNIKKLYNFNYVYGTLDGFIQTYEYKNNDTIMTEFTLVNGIKQGSCNVYLNNHIYKEFTYIDNKIHGTLNEYEFNKDCHYNQLIKQIEYENNKPKSTYIHYTYQYKQIGEILNDIINKHNINNEEFNNKYLRLKNTVNYDVEHKEDEFNIDNSISKTSNSNKDDKKYKDSNKIIVNNSFDGKIYELTFVCKVLPYKEQLEKEKLEKVKEKEKEKEKAKTKLNKKNSGWFNLGNFL